TRDAGGRREKGIRAGGPPPRAEAPAGGGGWLRAKRRRGRRRGKANPPTRRASDMELKIVSLDGKAAGSIELPKAIFGLEPRADILHRGVRWQLAKRQRGTHDVKTRSEITRTGKKMSRQKATGPARHGPARVNLFRGGGRSFGPTPRSHAID